MTNFKVQLSNIKKKSFIQAILWILILSGLVSLLAYGISSFTAKPTIEIITTHVSKLQNENNSMQNVNYQKHQPN